MKCINYLGAVVLLGTNISVAMAASEGMTQESFKIDAPAGTSDKQMQQATDAFERFKDECPGLFTTHSERVETAKTELWEPMPYRADEYDWEYEVRFQATLAEDGGEAAGHTLDYYMSNNGWLTQKVQAAEICGHVGNSDRDTYVQFES
ncbi:hypothetical protein ACT3TY_05410 [Halomonas sp. AOP22-C1-8]|uniref:hypothetical protein n=1 Tax=Halomonas sp. AOP22-C1-8 TaxID=3457717 RepID=UPI00403425F3